MLLRTLLMFSIFSSVCTAAADLTAPPPAIADWPQYRGPTRDGIAPVGPKLLDHWPKEGPKLIWKSASLWNKLGGGTEKDLLPHSGCGSITIAGGRAFIFANFKRNTGEAGKVVLTTKDLTSLGWIEGVPDDLAKKVEVERTKGKGAKLKRGPELDAYAKKYIADVDPELTKQFGPWIQRRLTKEPPPKNLNRLIEAEASALNGDPIFEWSFLEKLATVRDKEFPTVEAMDAQLDGVLNPWKSNSGNAVRVLLINRAISYFDAIICLDAATGAQIWRKEFPGSVSPYAGAANVGASSTPAIWEDKCYVAGSTAMYCLSVNDGSVVWQDETEFSNSSPLLKNGIAYVLVPEPTAYDAKTGRILWRQPSLNNPNSSFISWSSGGKDYLIISFQGGVYSTPSGGIYCLDPANGAVLWKTFCPGSSVPVLAGVDTLVMESSHNMTMAFKISPEKIEKIWETKKTGDTRGESPVIFQDHVYISGGCHSNNPLRCLDLKTGEILWNPRQMSAAEASSPVLVDGKIIAMLENSENSLYAVMYRATPEQYEELGRFNPDAGPGASPVVVSGKLYLRLQDCIACYDLTGPDQGAPAFATTRTSTPPLTITPASTTRPAATNNTKPVLTDSTNIRGWRGDGTGHFALAEPPTQWSETKNVKWRTAVGAGSSTPVASGNRVFVTSEKCTLNCIDRKSGQLLWKKTTRVQDAPADFRETVQDSFERPRPSGLAAATPVCDGEHVFVLFGTGEVSCYDFEGNRTWSRFIKPAAMQYGHSASPLLADGTLVVSLDGLTALDSKTGKTIWENKAVKPAYGCPVLMTLGATRLVITPTGFVVRLADGSILAKEIAENLEGDEYSISPLVHDNVVYYMDSNCSAVKLSLNGESVVKKTLWTTELPEAAIGSPTYHNGLIFVCTTTGHYSVCDATTGKPVLIDPKSGKSMDDCVLGQDAPDDSTVANFYPSVTIADKCVYVSNDKGRTFVLDAAKSFKEVQRNTLPAGSGASLFFDGSDLFIRGGNDLYRVTGK